MTSEELYRHFNETFGISEWPKSYAVDAATYANVCQSIFKWANSANSANAIQIQEFTFVPIALGPYGGVMFKNVELILE